MAKYVIDENTLTAISDPIRTLMGLTSKLSPSAMASNVTGANTKIGDQTEIIANILSALDGKTAGEGRKFYSGTFVTAEKTRADQYQIPLSTFGNSVPEYMFVWRTSPSDLVGATDGYSLLYTMLHVTGENNNLSDAYSFFADGAGCALNSKAQGYASYVSINRLFHKRNTDYITLNFIAVSGACHLYAGYNYEWLAISGENGVTA